MDHLSIANLTFKYVLSMSNSKKYNPQTIANKNVLNNYGLAGIKKELDREIKDFCEKYSPMKARDFIYKNDYFTPRNMYLINPLYYTYYTNIVFKIANLFLANETKIGFSNDRMRIFYSGILDFNLSEKEIRKNAMFNYSYKSFQREREIYLGKPVLKIDLQDFFNSIKVKRLINKLKNYFGEQKVIDDLEYFFNFCEFEQLPQLHYSIASSILSQIYLMDFDTKIKELLERENLYLIRFVDDMFIIHLDGKLNEKKNNSMLNEISYFLWEDELVLNSSKTKLLSPEEYKCSVELINIEYNDNQKSFLSEKIIDERAEEIISNRDLIILIETLCQLEESVGIDLKRYRELVNEYISIEGEDARKVLNNIIFSEKWRYLKDEDLLTIVKNWKYILFNPSQFTILYMLVCRYLESKKLIDGSKVKKILNYLYRNKYFNFRDTLVAVAYLFQNNKKNKELLKRVETVNKNYVDFIESFI
jgi:hypothetical protein